MQLFRYSLLSMVVFLSSISSVLLWGFLPSSLKAQEAFQPYFASLRYEKVNLRTGPGMQYMVEWVYQRKLTPVEVINKYKDWLQIRDIEKTTGWVRQDQVTSARTAITTTVTLLYRDNNVDSATLARIEAGVFVSLEKCEGAFCQIRVKDYQGWVVRQHLWGIYATETLN